MRPKSTILESLTAARIQEPCAVTPAIILYPEHLQSELGSKEESGPTQAPRSPDGSHDKWEWLTRMIAQMKEFAEADDGIDRAFSERVAPVRVALENTSAADTATHDRGFAIQVSKLTKAQVLSLTPRRARLSANQGRRIRRALMLAREQ